MRVVSLVEAETHLLRLVEAIESGVEKEIIIARDGKPAARLVPIGAASDNGKRLGLLEGKYPSSTQEEFDEANDEIAGLFRGEE